MVSRRLRFFARWRKAGMGLRLGLLAVAGVLLALLVYWQHPQPDIAYFGNNLLIFVLVNLNVVILGVLVFLVGRNVAKLVFDRRKRILGSKLRMRLVVAFVSVTLVPTIILFILASGLLTRAMEGWFSNQVETSVDGAVKVAKLHYNFLEQATREAVEDIAQELEMRQLSFEVKDILHAFLDKQRKEHDFFGIVLLDPELNEYVGSHNVAADLSDFREPPSNALAIEKAKAGEMVTLFEEQGPNQFIRVYRPVRMLEQSFVLKVTNRMNSELTQAMAAVNSSFREYEQLKLFRHPLRSGYLLTLSMITGLILFGAIWFGFYLAREISIPIQRLAEGTRAVAKGNYDFQIRPSGDDELGYLVRSFNTMTRDLKDSVISAESRRLLIETIFANLAVGVIALDHEHRITSANAEAIDLHGISGSGEPFGKKLSEVFPRETYEQVEPLLEEIEDSHSGVALAQHVLPVEREITVHTRGRAARILCTAAKITDPRQGWLGTVLIFDDITELSRTQQLSAWREVARRIAHEIKNPLTPLQLSAQRLHRAFTAEGSKPEYIESVETIVEHVDSIKRLANEFSNFARMPTAEFEPSDLNELISDTLATFSENHPDAVFQFVAEGKMPEVYLDREQIRRVLLNLLENSIAAIRLAQLPGPGRSGEQLQGRIVIRAGYDRRSKIATFEVIDNGVGIRDADKPRIFQPYFTTKREGTGLGLAIVASIVSDHQGEIRVYDNPSGGAKFIVELPLAPKTVTQRRFAAA